MRSSFCWIHRSRLTDSSLNSLMILFHCVLGSTVAIKKSAVLLTMFLEGWHSPYSLKALKIVSFPLAFWGFCMIMSSYGFLFIYPLCDVLCFWICDWYSLRVVEILKPIPLQMSPLHSSRASNSHRLRIPFSKSSFTYSTPMSFNISFWIISLGISSRWLVCPTLFLISSWPFSFV